MKKLFKYFFYTLILFSLFSTIVFFNLGNILDVSETPKKADVIFSLGGGQKGDRTLKSIKLLKEGFSDSNLLVITGDPRTTKMKNENIEDKRIALLKKEGLSKDDYIHIKNVKNTKEEILFIKNYLLEKKLDKAIIVSDPPHTRRIKTLFNLLNVKGDDKLKAIVIGTNVTWWDPNNFNKTKKAQAYVLKESIKTVYAYFVYGFLDSIGVLDRFETMFLPYIQEINRRVYRKAYYYQRGL